MSEIFTLGIDVGSTASKCIILKDGKEIVGKSLIDVGAGTSGPKPCHRGSSGRCRPQERRYGIHTGYRLWTYISDGRNCR